MMACIYYSTIFCSLKKKKGKLDLIYRIAVTLTYNTVPQNKVILSRRNGKGDSIVFSKE